MITAQINARPVILSLDRLARDVSRPDPALKLAAIMAQGFIQRNLKAGKFEDGSSWPELAASTILRRRNKKKGTIKPLIDTGRLLNSINYRIEPPASFAVGSKVIYAAAQNFGWKHIPARTYMWVNSSDVSRLAARIDSWVMQRIRTHGLGR